MSKGFLERLIDIGINGTALATSTAQTSLMLGVTGEMATLPAKYFERIGKSFRFRAAGRMGTVVTSPGTLTLKIRLGAVDVWSSGAIPLNIVAKTDVPWELVIEDLVCRSIGSSTSATLLGIGRFNSEAVIGAPLNSVGGNGSLMVPVGAPTVGTGFDSTSAQLFDFNATWSTSNAANTIRLETLAVDAWV